MMTLTPDISVRTHCAAVDDPRVDRAKRRQLLDIPTIALCAMIRGADTGVEVEAFGRARKAWFATFLTLEQGSPRTTRLAGSAHRWTLSRVGAAPRRCRRGRKWGEIMLKAERKRSCGSRRREALHRSFSPARRLVGVLGPVV